MLTHLRHRAAPLLRFRTRDHVEFRTGTCACGRTGPRVRCIGRTDDMLIVRGVNVFPSAVREVVGGFAPARQRPDPRAAPGGRDQAGAAAAGRASSSARRRPPTPSWPRRSGGGCARRSWSRPRSSSCRGRACSAASTSRSSSSDRAEEEASAKAPEPGRPPHHDRRRRPADVDRLLGGRARDAVRLRAAEPRQRVREPPLLRSRRRAADHDLHQRGARRPTRTRTPDRSRLRAPPRVRASRRRPSARRSSGSTSAGSSTAGSRTAASWTRSTSRTRSAC